MTDERHWIEELTLSERLELVKMRVEIAMKIAEHPENPAYIEAMA